MSFTRSFLPAAFSAAALAALAGTACAQSSRNWMTYNGDLRGDRFSALHAINTSTVKRLRLVASFNTGEAVSFQTGPLVVEGALYFTTYQTTYAIDAATGQLLWKRLHTVPQQQRGLGAARGLAYANGMVFRGFNDGHFVALRAATGALIWDKVIADPAKGESLPTAPIAWNGDVFVGNAGGDNFGVTGRVYALDAKTGTQKWIFNTVPTSGPAAATWTNRSGSNPVTGGALWTTFSLDPAFGVLYIPTGNSAPDFAEALHPGQDLYSCSIVALDARSGVLLGYAQPFKNDFHDWDMAAAPVIIKSRGGRQMAIAGGKDGLLYGMDRTGLTGAARLGNLPVSDLPAPERLAVNQSTPGQPNSNSSSSTPPSSGSTPPSSGGSVYGLAGPGAFSIIYHTPITRRFNTGTPLNDKTFTRFAPGSQGGMEWNGPAYDPDLNLIFTPATDWPSSVKLAPPSALTGQTGKPWTGSYDKSFGRQDPKRQWGGYLTAIDADTGSMRWHLHTPTPLVGGVTPTAGGLVFCGDVNGLFSAFDARTGQRLWSDATGQPIGGGVISYESGGRQFIAVAAAMKSALWPVKAGTARILIYALPSVKPR